MLDGLLERSEVKRGLMIVESGNILDKSPEVIIGPSVDVHDFSGMIKVHVLNPRLDSIAIDHAEVITLTKEIYNIREFLNMNDL